MKLSVNGTESADAKPARTPEVGKAYYLYATWNGTDLVFADKDFTVPQTGTKISIADLRANYVADGTYAEDHFIEGEVVLNAENGNVNALAAYVADETAGISFFFTFGDDVVTDAPLGAKVRINLEGATWDSYNGLIQLKSLSTSTAVEILEPTATTPLEPRVVTIQELLDGNYQSELVQVNNVQFKNVPATYGSNPDLIDNNAIEINVRSSSGATFKDENVPEGNGPFIGVVGMFYNAQLHVRETADLADMTGPRYVPPFINVNPFSLTFEKEAGSETIAVTANVAWTATSDAAWATISPANGTNDGAIAVSVEANTGADARTATITITDGDVATTVNVTQAGASETFATDLFFSEYIEGSSNNKYLEIYNGTGVDVDLADYQVELYSNGRLESAGASKEVILSSLQLVLKHGEVIVLKHSSANLGYSGAHDSSVCNFNGNDAIVLRKLSTGDYVDIIGRIGEQTKWSADGDLRTTDRTLIRKPSVRGGVTVNPTEGFPTLASEGIGYPVDTA